MKRLVLLVAILVSALAAVAHADGRCGSRTCRADVSVSGHAEPQPVRPGDESEFTFTPMNNGEDGALKIDFQVTIPDGLKIVSVRNFGGNSCTTQGTFVRCDLGDFADQQQAVVRIKVKALRVGTYIANGKVFASDVDDPNGGNNQTSATLHVQQGVNAPGDGGARLKASDPQRVLKSGGVNLRVRATTSGTFTFTGEVRTKNGRVSLSKLQRGVREGETFDVFLGTGSRALARIREGFKSSSRLRTILRAKTPAGTARLEIHLRR